MLNLHGVRTLLRDWRIFIIFIITLILVRGAVADWYTVPTGSMKPTILEGDRIFVNKMAFGLRIPFTDIMLTHWGIPRRGEIVVFTSPEDGGRLIKRVIGLPGDTLELRDNKLFINGQAVDYQPADKQYPVTIWREEINRDVIDELLEDHRHPIALTPANTLIEDYGPVKVPADHYFMMGDNRHNSADSRYIGFVDRTLLLGRASHIVVSLDYNNYYKPRKGRTFTELH